MRVLAEERADGDIESEDVPPAGHELEGHEGTALAGGHEGVDSEDEVEFGKVGYEVV